MGYNILVLLFPNRISLVCVILVWLTLDDFSRPRKSYNYLNWLFPGRINLALCHSCGVATRGDRGSLPLEEMDKDKIGTKIRRNGTERRTSSKGAGKKKASKRKIEIWRCKRKNVVQGSQTLYSHGYWVWSLLY